MSSSGKPEPIAGTDDAVDVAGDFSGCIARRSGAVGCWFSPQKSVRAIPGVRGAVQVVHAGTLACARTGDGSVWCWNWGHQLVGKRAPGDPVTTEEMPLRVARVTGVTGAVHLVAGGWEVCAMTRRDVRCWSEDRRAVPLEHATGATALAFDREHSCVARGGRDVACWGRGLRGELGFGWTDARAQPILVPGISDAIEISTSYSPATEGQWSCGLKVPDGDAVPIAGLTDVTQLAIGRHACARRCNREVVCFTTPDRLEAVGQISAALDLSAGETASCVVRADYTVWCWGDEDIPGWSLNGPPRKNPILPVPELGDVASISLGGHHACARKTDGTVWCWGDNEHGQLGDGTTSRQTQPQLVPKLGPVVQISAGTTHTCALLANGSVACWGETTSGQIGTHAMNNIEQPIRVLW